MFIDNAVIKKIKSLIHCLAPKPVVSLTASFLFIKTHSEGESTFGGPTGCDASLAAISFSTTYTQIRTPIRVADQPDLSFRGPPLWGLRETMEVLGFLKWEPSGAVVTLTLSVALLALLKW